MATDIPVKPRVLIADDSRIVRATLIKHIEGMFEFREALDGEQAWETLLLDPHIRVVITDLTMPRLDGYGLLRRIRSSKIGRIRDLPVVVVSGSDEEEERERAKAAGANDLITKGIGTAQLLSRLDILSRLVNTQREFERGLEALISKAPAGALLPRPPLEALHAHAESLLAGAIRNKKNFVILNVCIGLKQADPDGNGGALPPGIVDAIGELLQRTVRQTDHVARSGNAEFTLATGSINFDSARTFAQRICRAIANANLPGGDRVSLVASCGVVSLNDTGVDAECVTLKQMLDLAHKRALLGMERGVTGVVGPEEEAVFRRGGDIVPSAEAGGAAIPELATLIQWLKEGREAEVLQHIDKLSSELRPLIDLMMKQNKP
jgi:CheY-like chemotaxis protein